MTLKDGWFLLQLNCYGGVVIPVLGNEPLQLVDPADGSSPLGKGNSWLRIGLTDVKANPRDGEPKFATVLSHLVQFEFNRLED